MVVALTVSYRGGGYAGWQRQPNAVTVQQRLEEALGALLGAEVGVTGAGRTDAGVHARGQVAHLEPPRDFPLGGLVHGTNHHLPEDIRVLAAERMRAGFHARKSARSKLYRYRLVRAQVVPPLDAPFALGVSAELDLAAMARAADLLPGENDFSAFALAGGAHGRPQRRMFGARWVERGAGLDFEIEGEGFLRGMVRGLVGTLLEIGHGRRTVEAFAGLLRGGERGDAGPTAPAHGLTLEAVRYDRRWSDGAPEALGSGAA